MKTASASAFLLLAACASAAPAGGWDNASWAAQAPKPVDSGKWGFSASPYGKDGFKLKLTIRSNAILGASGANGAPDEEQLKAAATAAAPEGCKVKSVAREPDGGAVAEYDCT